MSQDMYGEEVPAGFGIALFQNADAYTRFSNLPIDEQQGIIDGSFHIETRQEMKDYVEQIGKEQEFF